MVWQLAVWRSNVSAQSARALHDRLQGHPAKPPYNHAHFLRATVCVCNGELLGGRHRQRMWGFALDEGGLM